MSITVTDLPMFVLLRMAPDPNSGCWHWYGYVHPKGHGMMTLKRVTHYAHRYVYERLIGPVPAGLVLDHLCRVPRHLEPVTSKTNVLRGVGLSAQNARKTHCDHGHELSADNIYAWRGDRLCRECRRIRVREQRARKRLREQAACVV